MKFILLLLIVAIPMGVSGQRPRTVNAEADREKPARSETTLPPAPQTFKAKYEGGVTGYVKKQEGTLTFDDTNSRLLFCNKLEKEVLFIPYAAILAATADTQRRQPTAAKVMGSIPVPYGLNLPAAFIKKKYRYLNLNFEDPETKVEGIGSFQLANKEILASVLNTLAEKAGLTARGESFIRKKAIVLVDETNP